MEPTIRAHSGKHLLLATYTLLMFVLSGCAGDASPSSTTPSAALQPIRLQTQSPPSVDLASFYVADQQGYYIEQGLRMDLLAGGYDRQGTYIDPVKAVLEGQAEFGITTGTSLLQARANRLPVVAVAAIYQRLPLVLISPAEQQITKPQDLVGKTIQVASENELLVRALLTSQGIALNHVKIVPRTDFSDAVFRTGETNVLAASVTNEVITLRQQGQKINTIFPFDYGIEEYPSVVFTTERLIKEHPDVIERFLRATLRGMQDVIAEPDRAVTLMAGRNLGLSQAQLSEAVLQALPFLNPASSRPGMMSSRIWNISYQILHDQGIVTQALDVQAAYTLKFLGNIYTH